MVNSNAIFHTMSIKLVKTRKFYVFDRSDSKDWMSERLALATGRSALIDFASSTVRTVIEPDIQKCRALRRHILEKDDISQIVSVLESPSFISLAKKIEFKFEVHTFNLREEFLGVLGLDTSYELSELHSLRPYQSDDLEEKVDLLRNFTIPERRLPFHTAFDNFVLAVIAKHVGIVMPNENKLYYQSFPCIRLVRPNEFSIGIHSDISYGFSQANINFYVPLTSIQGSNSLVLESVPGIEDWHTIDAEYGTVVRFYGALCAHFTPENTTIQTRVSLDFRVIPGNCWQENHDHFTRNPGYYVSCQRDSCDTNLWHRSYLSVPNPDYRVGFPFSKKAHPGRVDITHTI